MRNLLRKPLHWIVLAECAVVTALVMVAWHLVAIPPVQKVPAALAASVLLHAVDPSRPISAALALRSPAGQLLPGLNLDANFWQSRLTELNRGEADFEQLEWRLVHSAISAAHHYVESVVLPSIARAERSRR
jgi:hypothetical protein